MAKANKSVVDEVTEVTETPDSVPASKAKKKKRLGKVLEGTVLTIKEADTESVLVFDFGKLPENIQALLGPYGMSQKLGDAAAGKRGQEAVDSINKVYEGLMTGNWSVRAPAAEKISKKSILGKFEAMPEGKEKEMAATLLKNLGILS